MLDKIRVVKELKCVLIHILNGASLYRALMNTYLHNIRISGRVLDLGAGRVGKATYHEILLQNKKSHIITINIAQSSQPHIVCDLETGIAIQNSQFDTVLAFNLFEHISGYQQLAAEIYRVLSKNGTAFVCVPFLIRVHLNPDDFFRYTCSGLTKIFQDAGFQYLEVIPLGVGPFCAAYAQIAFAIPRILRVVLVLGAILMDTIIRRIATLRGSMYRNEHDYPLGYFVMAKKLPDK